jgi:hypothetical protein
MKFIDDHARSEGTLFAQVVISLSAKEESSRQIVSMYAQKSFGLSRYTQA